MTPFMLEIFMHHSVSSAAFPRNNAPAYKDTLKDIIEIGLLEEIEFGFIQSTKMGKAYLKMVLSTPLPSSGYYDPRSGEVIKEE